MDLYTKYLYPPVDLYLISEKSIWKNLVQRTGFLVYFELDFYKLIFQKLSTDQQGDIGI